MKKLFAKVTLLFLFMSLSLVATASAITTDPIVRDDDVGWQDEVSSYTVKAVEQAKALIPIQHEVFEKCSEYVHPLKVVGAQTQNIPEDYNWVGGDSKARTSKSNSSINNVAKSFSNLKYGKGTKRLTCKADETI